MAIWIELDLGNERERALKEEAERIGMDVSDYAKELIVKQLAPSTAKARRPNEAALEVLRKVEEIQRGMNPGEGGKSAVELVREARQGALYGYEPIPDQP